MGACIGLGNASGAVAAESDPSATQHVLSQSDANKVMTEQFGPFKISFGQDSNGGFGANLNGQGQTALGHTDTGHEPEGTSRRLWSWTLPYLGYAASGTWTTSKDAANNASLSLKPGFDSLISYGLFRDPSLHATLPIRCDATGAHCVDGDGKPIPLATYPTPYLSAGGSGDAELRYGTVKQNGASSTAREFLVGGELYFIPMPRLWDLGMVRSLASPHFSITYYHPSSVTGLNNITLPQGVKANFVQTEFETVLGFGDPNDDVLKFDVKFDASKATSGTGKAWVHLWTLKLWTPKWSFNGVNPTVAYQSGANGGFTYDRQVLLGALYEFLDPRKSN